MDVHKSVKLIQVQVFVLDLLESRGLRLVLITLFVRYKLMRVQNLDVALIALMTLKTFRVV